MTPWWRVAGQVWVQRWGAWLMTTLGIAAGYYVGLLAVMTLRFAKVPNYAVLYDAPGAFATIWSSTPSPWDAVRIMAEERLFEAGYKMPEFGIAEWTLTITMPNLLQVLAIAGLAALFIRLLWTARSLGCATSRQGAAAAGASAGLLVLCSASLTWVVCCATPSWIVALTLLGVSLSVAEAMGPYDALFTAIGMGLTVVAIALQARRIARRTAHSRAAFLG